MSWSPPLDLVATDDIGFVHRVRRLIAGAVDVAAAAEIYLIKVDRWFGPRWLGFAGKLGGALGVSDGSSLRVPPFVPARIVTQVFLRRVRADHYEVDEAAPLHVEQRSEDNFRRRVDSLCPDAALFWWSGETVANGRGCVMAYLPGEHGHVAWYAELARAASWTIARTQGTTAAELERLAAA